MNLAYADGSEGREEVQIKKRPYLLFIDRARRSSPEHWQCWSDSEQVFASERDALPKRLSGVEGESVCVEASGG